MRDETEIRNKLNDWKQRLQVLQRGYGQMRTKARLMGMIAGLEWVLETESKHGKYMKGIVITQGNEMHPREIHCNMEVI
jgi:hypothetical protein